MTAATGVLEHVFAVRSLLPLSVYLTGIVVSAVFMRRTRQVALPSLLGWVCFVLSRFTVNVTAAVSSGHDQTYAQSDLIWETGLVVQSLIYLAGVCLLVTALVLALRTRPRAG